MSAKRRGTGDAQSPNKQGHKQDSQANPSYLYAPVSSGSINYPDNGACGGIAFVPNESPPKKRPNSFSEDDLYPMDLSKQKKNPQTSRPNHPDYVASGGTDLVQKESPRGTRSEVVSEEDEYPLDLTKPMEKLQTSSPKKSSVYSGLHYPSNSKERSSMDKDAGGAAGSQNYPSQREFITPGITNERIQFTLLQRELWRNLSRQGNEMMVRYDGCFMSPALRLKISGLVKNRLYSVFVEFPVREKCTWMYDKSTWKIESTAEEQKKVPRVKHPESPSPGGYWMDRALHFENLKICSNFENVDPNKAGLKIFHAYQPRITVVEVDKYGQPKTGTSVSVSFQETSFVVITGTYRNPRVRAIKATIS